VLGQLSIQDVKMLRQQFRQARQEVDTLEDQLTEMEKKDTNVKEASNREKEDQLILERLGNQLKYNMKKLEEEQIILGKVLQAGREASNHLHQDRVMVERMARLLEDSAWRNETASVVGVKCLVKVKVEVAGDEEVAADVEENRLEVVLGEKLCELESVQNFVEGAQKVVAQMTTYCSIREEEEVQGDMMAEMELGEMMRLWVEEQRDREVELQTLRNIVVSLEDQKMEREKVLKEGAEGGRVVNVDDTN
jgi:hypothetical protein